MANKRSKAGRNSMSSDQSSGQSMNENTERKAGSMSVSDAGKLGGQRTAETHGREFYQEIGAQGGRSRSGGNNSNFDE